MSAPCIGPCSPYVTFEDLCSPCIDIPYPDDSVDQAIADASDLLYFATGQQFPGSCREVVRPCSSQFSGSYSCGLYGHPSSCGCSPFQQVELGFTPVTSINEVRVCGPTNPDWRADGSGTCVLSPSLYHIDEFHYLVRDPNPDDSTPGWPTCSSMSPNTSANDVFQVDFVYGQPVPSILKRATAILACELVIGCNQDAFPEAECRLPRNVVSLTRQGVSMVLQSAFFTPQRGKPVVFGIPEVDMAIGLLSPYGNVAPSIILSADNDGDVRRVNT